MPWAGDGERLASLRLVLNRVASVQDVVRVAGCELVRMRLPMAWCKIRRLTAGIPPANQKAIPGDWYWTSLLAPKTAINAGAPAARHHANIGLRSI